MRFVSGDGTEEGKIAKNINLLYFRGCFVMRWGHSLLRLVTT